MWVGDVCVCVVYLLVVDDCVGWCGGVEYVVGVCVGCVVEVWVGDVGGVVVFVFGYCFCWCILCGDVVVGLFFVVFFFLFEYVG